MTMSNDDWAYSRKINVDYSSEVTCENFNSMYEVLNKRFETLFKFNRSRDAGNVMFYSLAAESQGASAPGWIAAFD